MGRRIKAIIFDMDGVLIDAKEWHYEALNKALNLFGFNISRHEHELCYDGLPTRDKLKILTKEKGLSQALHQFVNEMKQAYTMEMIHSSCRPTFHHEYALSRLVNEGYKIAVASNSISDTVSLMMSKSRLLKYLDFFVSNEDVVHGKPNPEMYLLCFERLGLSAEECLVVEDNDKGIAAAKAAGANVLAVTTVHEVNYQNIAAFISALEGSLLDA